MGDLNRYRNLPVQSCPAQPGACGPDTAGLLPNRYDGGAMTRRHQTTPLSRHAKAWLKPLIALVALVLVFEEWLWARLRDGVHRLSHWPAVRRFEGALKRLSPWASLAVLLTPMVVLLPFKVGALWLLGHGHVLWGVLTLITAKLTGTAVAAYLFDLVRNQARQLRWFDRLYCRVELLLVRAHAWLHRQPLYTEARDRVRLLGIRWQAIWGKWRQQWGSHPPGPWSRRLRKVQSRWVRSRKKPP